MARTPRTLAEKHAEKPEEGSKRTRSRSEYTVMGAREEGGQQVKLITLRTKDDVSAFLNMLDEHHEGEWHDITIRIGKVWSPESFMNGQE